MSIYFPPIFGQETFSKKKKKSDNGSKIKLTCGNGGGHSHGLMGEYPLSKFYSVEILSVEQYYEECLDLKRTFII
jgi:hypothetical protein